MALLREAGIQYKEGRSRIFVDITSVSLEEVYKFHDLTVVYFAMKFGEPHGEEFYSRPEIRDSIRHYPIVQRVNGVFNDLKAYTRY